MRAPFRSAPRLLALLCATATLPALADSPTRLLRFPDVHGELVRSCMPAISISPTPVAARRSA